MSDLRDLTRDTFQKAKNLPDVIAERCVHALIEVASCQACVDVCPHGAWVLDDEQLGIDANRCDGCNLCVAACPQGAIQADMPPLFRRSGGRRFAMFACEYAGLEAGPGVIPCLHAISVSAIMTLYRNGTDTVISCSSNCDQCDRKNAPLLGLQLNHFNRMLCQRRLPELHHQQVDAREWGRLSHGALTDSAGPPISRRQFFLRTTRSAIGGHERLVSLAASSADGFEPAGSIIPSQTTDQLVPFLPRIDPNRCNACDACARLCPHAAVHVHDGDQVQSRAYRIAPDRCSGCGICKDVCDQQAISVSTWAIPQRLEIALSADRCSSCGVTYFTPTERLTENVDSCHQCRICLQTGHRQLLYQVLD